MTARSGHSISAPSFKAHFVAGAAAVSEEWKAGRSISLCPLLGPTAGTPSSRQCRTWGPPANVEGACHSRLETSLTQCFALSVVRLSGWRRRGTNHAPALQGSGSPNSGSSAVCCEFPTLSTLWDLTFWNSDKSLRALPAPIPGFREGASPSRSSPTSPLPWRRRQSGALPLGYVRSAKKGAAPPTSRLLLRLVCRGKSARGWVRLRPTMHRWRGAPPGRHPGSDAQMLVAPAVELLCRRMARHAWRRFASSPIGPRFVAMASAGKNRPRVALLLARLATWPAQAAPQRLLRRVPPCTCDPLSRFHTCSDPARPCVSSERRRNGAGAEVTPDGDG